MEKILKQNRESLSDNSIKTYSSNIRSLYKKMNTDTQSTPESIHKFFNTNSKKVLDFLKDIEPSKRKTVLASLVVLCNGNSAAESYRSQMIKDAYSYNENLKDQTKTDSQKASWITQDNVMKIYRRLYRNSLPLINKDKLTNHELQELQDLVILSVYVLIPPRRLLDYTLFKVRNAGEKDNFMDGKHFVFNTYKTANKYKQQRVLIPTRLKSLITKWMTKHNNDYLLFDERNNPLAPPKLTSRLNRIFGGRNISVNQLRHTFITDRVLPNVPALKMLQGVAEDMGHSVETQLLYKKN